ncbi:MAG: cellobiose phosphorylase [Candidatus Omnitrophica bacterium]|nr:cellobiose phosphorylase [Candidatus Omnitrophota bacterium]
MSKTFKEKKVAYHLTEQGEFIIENFNAAKPLANFFPGIAGKYGIPMWVFYVNRGQAINSFGTDGKDGAILEFQPANKAWQQTSLLGFRTFIKVLEGSRASFYEPFHNGFTSMACDLQNRMSMTSYDLKLEETNKTLGLKTNVEYFTIPQEDFAGLVRIVTIKNCSRKKRTLQLLDGLPRIVPYGIANLFLKKLSRTIEAWMRVENLGTGVPFYKVNVDPIDRPYVIHVKGGNFYLGFHEQGKKAKLIRPIVDPEVIFGPINDFACPRRFLTTPRFKYPSVQQTQCKTPCGFLLLDLKLNAGEEKKFYTVVGNCRDRELLNSSAVKKILSPGYLSRKDRENEQLIRGLQQDIETRSSSWEFDYYCKQTYLDNVMRGGTPIVFNAQKAPSVFYLYSRKHGDLERDYNKFQIQPTYFSQGNGNYRDMNQNRRCDVWFHPQIKDFNIVTFLNLLQLDGFNPLIVKGATFSLNDAEAFSQRLKGNIASRDMELILGLLEKPFTPGQVMMFLEERRIKISMAPDEFLDALFSCSTKNPEADHGEGFWTDHWHYNLDLLESYLGIYPENLKELVFDKKAFTFFDNWHVVRPRREKYILLDGVPKQLHSVVVNEEKKMMINARTCRRHAVRAEYGKGPIYTTTLVNMLFCLLANKLASLDPFGVGVEMEADKPNWFDALNGLPALFGSSACETFELKRLCLFIKDTLAKTRVEKFYVSSEVYEFLMAVIGLVEENLNGNAPDRDFSYWDKSYSLKEAYREKIKFGVSGRENELLAADAVRVLDSALAKLDRGLQGSRYKDKPLYCGYFINRVSEFELEDNAYARPIKFEQEQVVPFLEAQVHALRLTEDHAHAKEIYDATKSSPQYDKKLAMYKVTAPLAGMPEELGRCLAFTPGWLENESVWLHMEYKYLLEILEHGLYDEFYKDFKNALIPFQKPETYGRSILENSSFVVSSAFPYPALRGNGFVARLSGSTVEFLQMWLHMNIGKKPFLLSQKHELCLVFAPVLAGWLFDPKAKTYSFKFLGSTTVTYHNPRRKNTFGTDAVRPVRVILKDCQGTVFEFDSDTVPAPQALRIRQRKISSIDVFLE